MAKLLSAGETVEWEPPWQDRLPAEKRVRYWLAVPTPPLRLRYRRRCTALGARRVTPRQLLDAIAAELSAMEPGPDQVEIRDRHLALVTEVQEAWDARAARLTAGEYEGEEGAAAYVVDGEASAAQEAEVEAIGRALVEFSPRLADLYAAGDTWTEAAGLAAAEVFLAGWENIATPFRRAVPDRLPDPVLMAVPELHLRLLALHIETLFAPTEEEQGNSAPPSSSPSTESDSGTTSTAPPTDL
ncbi:MAG: hypothetical protein RLO22_25440 [Sneathiellaceae bacterium]